MSGQVSWTSITRRRCGSWAADIWLVGEQSRRRDPHPEPNRHGGDHQDRGGEAVEDVLRGGHRLLVSLSRSASGGVGVVAAS